MNDEHMVDKTQVIVCYIRIDSRASEMVPLPVVNGCRAQVLDHANKSIGSCGCWKVFAQVAWEKPTFAR